MNPTNIVIGIAVLAFVVFRQLQRRSVKEDSRPVLLLVLLAVGAYELVTFLTRHPAGPEAIAMLVASLVLAAGFGAIRAYTVRLWREDGVLYRQGNALTLLLWLVAIGLHFGADLLIDRSGAGAGLSSAALLLYIAVSFGVQRLIVQARAGRMQTAGALN